VIAAPALRLAVVSPATSSAVTSDWRERLPILHARGVTLRELRLTDAVTLLAMLSTDEVSRFISPPPTTVEGFERFIQWAIRERAAGTYVCFGVVPDGQDHAVGIFQVRTLGNTFDVAEWGFALGSPFWGTGIFIKSARTVVNFCVAVLGTTRLEARSCVANTRGNGALQKLGAVREGTLRKSFLRHGAYHDQVIWSIVVDDWEVRDPEVVRH
jgi:RimJ/RimL family protein N-acetyltransferase